MKKITEIRLFFWSGLTVVKFLVAFVLSMLLLWLLPIINLLVWIGVRPDSPNQEKIFSWISFGVFLVVIYTITSILFNRAKKSLERTKVKAEAEKMKCKEGECEGEIDQLREIVLKTGCGPVGSPAYPCNRCGRLHWASDGELVFNRPGDRAFLEDGRIVTRDEKNEVTFTI
jgi:hypothetical protein